MFEVLIKLYKKRPVSGEMFQNWERFFSSFCRSFFVEVRMREVYGKSSI